MTNGISHLMMIADELDRIGTGFPVDINSDDQLIAVNYISAAP